MIEWYLETIPLKNLKINPKNPRKISKEQFKHLENLIKKFGIIDRPIVNHDGTIIGGHQRIQIFKKMKMKEVECWKCNIQFSDEDIQHLGIGLNLNQGDWDYDILANEYECLDLLSYGFSEEQLIGEFEEKPSKKKSEEECEEEKLTCCPKCGHEF